MRAILLMLVVVALAGCADQKNLIAFKETDNTGQQIRQLSFVLTDKPAKTCLGGNWKSAKLVRGQYEQIHDPAYELENGKLEVLLDNWACDNYDSYVGTLANGQFRGDHVSYGLGVGDTLGKVSGTYTK